MNSNHVQDEEEISFVHPWGAQTAGKIHAGLTAALGVLAFPFLWLHSRVLGTAALQAKFDAIAEGKDETVQVHVVSNLDAKSAAAGVKGVEHMVKELLG